MRSTTSHLKSLIQSTSLPFGDVDEDAQIYTPKEFVSGFVAPPRGVQRLEAAWHAAAVALETERVRVVQHEADDGIYFLAAAAGDFVSHPNARTPLAAALPGAPGHKGDGAYFVDLGSGIVGVVVKGPQSLKCYVGERGEATQFADGLAHYWPRECETWVGFRQYESRHARRLAQTAIIVGMALTAILLGLSVMASAASEMFSHRKDTAIEVIRTEQQRTSAQLGAQPVDAYQEYRKLAGPVVKMGGKLNRFESAGGATAFEAEFPSWVSDLSALGGGVKTRVEDARVLASK